uniref:Wu:fj29h11 n=1 Tax=Lepisosteus oculatus TaxID=7918 RepID=W5MY83_LEPOC
IEAFREMLQRLCKRYPGGFPVNRISKNFYYRYQKPLSVRKLGFKSVKDLVASMSDIVDMVKQFFHFSHIYQNKIASSVNGKMEKACWEVTELLKQHSQGIPLKKLALFYSQKYKRNLTVRSFGFPSVTSFIDFLKDDLHIEEDLVFHNSHHRPISATSVLPGPETSKALEMKWATQPLQPQAAKAEPSVGSATFNLMSDHNEKFRFGLLFYFIVTGGEFPTPKSFLTSVNKLSKFRIPLQKNVKVFKQNQRSNRNSTFSSLKEIVVTRHMGKGLLHSLDVLYDSAVVLSYSLKSYVCYFSNISTMKIAKQRAESPQPPKPTVQGPALLVTPAAVFPGPSHWPPVVPFPVASAVSQSDFPALGAKLTKAQQKNLQGEAAQKERSKSSAPVFKEAYNAQMREIHNSNMQAAEVLEGLSLERRPGRNFSISEVNSLAQDCIRAIAAEGELVTSKEVDSRICRLLRIKSLHSIQIVAVRDLTAVKELQRTLREINSFIESVEGVRTVCTLYELGQSLAALKNKKRFEELSLGPLCKIPLIHRMFKVDRTWKDDDIREIETVDIIKSLRVFMKEYNLNRSKVDLADFMKHLADQYNCESPYELGVRIQSIALSISTLRKAVKSEHESMDKARATIQREIMEEVETRMRKIKRTLMEPAQGPELFSSGGSRELRKKYTSLTAAEAVLEVFKNTEGVFSTRMTKHVQDFLLRVSGDRLSTALFQLAICGGSLEVPTDLVAKEKTHKPTQDKETREQKAAVETPSEASVKQYFQEKISKFNGLPDLSYLSKLEKAMVNHFKFKEFAHMEHGTFLEFLVKQSQILKEAGVGALPLSSWDSRACGFRPSQQDVFEFLKQCGVEGQDRVSELPAIESALRNHYKVRDSRELGYGSLSTLVVLVQRQKQQSNGIHASPVRYEAPLFAREARSSWTEANESVGLLGPQSIGNALACLLSAPLLEDLSEWSQWELVFEPEHGNLKDFIEKNAGDLVALEVKPGILLRVTNFTSPQLFAEAATALDPIDTAGHLVSVVLADGIANAPIALLANHMESSLAAAMVQEDFSQPEEALSLNTTAKFVLDCLIRIPTKICKSLIKQIFLEPFSKVLGQAKSKAVLLQAARSDRRYKNRLHQMGLLLGLTEWVKDFQTKLSSPQLPVDTSAYAGNMNHVSPAARSADSMSQSSKSLVADFSDEEPELESDSEPEDNSSSQISGKRQKGPDTHDEEQNYELTSEQNSQVSNTSESQGLSSGAVNADPAEMDVQGSEDLGKSLAEERVNQCKAIIDDIRKTEFGIGVDLNEEGRNLMNVHQERLGRSLDRLSTELYSKDTHFVLELIQNADDNSYPVDGGLQPALTFMVEKDCISILNNECGFEERNIRAVCDVGRSTKGKHKYGYIGQKGIGFKSVFKVTDCPEIHSNGFHICFDKNSGPMGYILPHWLETERPLPVAEELKLNSSWTTKIILPLRCESYQTRNLFHDVHPSLLLFLHRLRSITIVNQSENRVISMTRRDLAGNVLEVQHTDGTERWLVLKRTLCAKKIKDNVESTEIALAFKLSNGDDCQGLTMQPEKQPVFAFLPLRSFGFRFIIQGDFDIPSSREDVDRDSPWNQWLRSEIPQLFLHAMDIFMEHPEFSGLQGLCQFLQFIPLPDEILDFFNPVAGKIIQLLKGKACLPTKEDKEGNVEFKLPSQIAVSQDVLIQEVISPELLQRHLNLSYLHPALQSALPHSLITALGVHRLRGSDITAITSAMAQELLREHSAHSGESLKKVAKLLVCNFRTLEQEYQEADAMLQALRKIPIIPLADGRMVALDGVGVFFPLSDPHSVQTATAQGVISPCMSIHKSLSLSSTNELPESQSENLKKLLSYTSTLEALSTERISSKIYPILKSGTWKVKPEDIVISYLVFIKQHSCGRDYVKLDAAIPVFTNKGFVCPRETKVQFSEEYGNIDLPSKLPGVDWVLLHSCYLKADLDPSGWREFFSALGVQDLFIFKKTKRSLTLNELASSPWALDCELWPRTSDSVYVIEDHQCDEFHALVTADQLDKKQKLGQRRELLGLLNKNWVTGDHYSQYKQAQVFNSQGHKLKDARSSFTHYLTTLPWVPAFRADLGSYDQHTVEYMCPSKVYLYSPGVFSLLGVHVNYVDMSPSEFTNSIGMKHSVSIEEVITHLKSWCTKKSGGSSEEIEGADFTTSVQHLHNVYTYLYENCNPTQLKDLFLHTPAVFIAYERTEEMCSGRFYLKKEVCWNDPTEMFLRYKDQIRKSDGCVQEPRILAPFYGQLQNMKDLFCKCLDVEPNPSMKQYVDLLELICSPKLLPTAEILQDVSIIYAKLADKCKTPEDQESELQMDRNRCVFLKEMLSDKKVFPTKDLCWVTLARRPLIPDNKTLEKVFKSHTQVCLLSLPPAEKPKKLPTGKRIMNDKNLTFNEKDRALFLEICGIKKLSECVTTQAQTENYRPCPPVQALIRKVVPYIQKFLYYHDELGNIYEDLQERNIAQQIKALSFGQVGKLYIQYQLNLPDEEPLYEREDVICLLKDNKELYIQKDHITSTLDIWREIVKLFSTKDKYMKELERFLQGLMSCLDDEAALTRFLKTEDIREIPSTEEKWEVPEPVEIRLEPREDHISKSASTTEEERRGGVEDGEKTLACWPPKSSLHGATSNYTGKGLADAAEAVMKMWPPPAEPSPSDLRGPVRLINDLDGALSGQRPVDTQPKPGKSRTSPDSGQPVAEDAVAAGPNPSEPSNILWSRESHRFQSGPRYSVPHSPGLHGLNKQVVLQSEPFRSLQPPPVLEADSTTFQGTDIQRPPIPLDSPVWAKEKPHQAMLEDLVIDNTVSRPKTVALPDESTSSVAVGEWGERYVYSFLTNWKDSGSPDGPVDIIWSNQDGESGHPYDFKVTFGTASNGPSVVFIEVKATVKAERSLLHLSANELSLALKEKDRYHIYRVYNAGDVENARLCRIKNLAQKLHAKELELFLFV